jgi:hypothetical protein
MDTGHVFQLFRQSTACLDALPPVQQPQRHTCSAPASFDLFARSIWQRWIEALVALV